MNYLFGKKHEVWFDYFPNGQISNKTSYDDGVPNGLNVSWYSNGQQKEKGSVIKESSEMSIAFYTKRGIWTKWYLNGQKSEKGTYVNGQKDGLWVEWYENGEKKSEGLYDKNKKEDTWTYWYDDGNKKSKGSYENGQLNGQWTKWNEWIWRNAAEYTTRENNISYTTWAIKWAMDFTENWNKGKKDGVWTWWNNDGYIDSTGEYVNDIKQGKWTEWDSTLQVQLETNWENNKKIGEIIHPSKKRKIYQSIITIEDGERTEWYADGQKSFEGTRRRTIKKEKWSSWHERVQASLDNRE